MQSSDTSHTKQTILAWSVLAFLLGGLIFLPQHDIQWPFHHWVLYTSVEKPPASSETYYRLRVDSTSPRMIYSHDLLTLDDISSLQLAGRQVMWGAANRETDTNQTPYRDWLRQYIQMRELDDHPVIMQECTQQVRYNQPLSPLQDPVCTDLFTLSESE